MSKPEKNRLLRVLNLPSTATAVAANDVMISSAEKQVVELSVNEQGQLVVPSATHHPLRVAVSCLVQPQAGDLVRVVTCQGGMFITDILARSCPHSVTLHCAGQRLEIVADDIALHGTSQVAIHTRKLAFYTRTTRWIADTLHQITRNLFVRSEHAHRQVTHTDQQQAQHIIQHAEQSYALRSEVGSIKASTVLKIDGSQIHMG